MTSAAAVINETERATPEQIAFEKARFGYCAAAFQESSARKQALEKKAEFSLTLVTLFLGALFLNLDFLVGLDDLLARLPHPALITILLYACLGGALVATVISLVSTVWSMRIQEYVAGYPRQPKQTLFAADSDYLDRHDEFTLLQVTAFQYADAVEHNQRLNDRKAAALEVASYSVLGSISLIALFMAAVAFLILQ